MKRLYFLVAMLCLGVGLAAQNDYSDYSLKADFDHYFQGVDLSTCLNSLPEFTMY